MKSLEKSTIALLGLVLFVISIYNVRVNPNAMIASAITLAAAIWMFYINAFKGYALIKKRVFHTFVLKSILPFLLLYLIVLVTNTFYYLSYSKDASFKIAYLLRAFPHKESAILPVCYILGLLYGYYKTNIRALKITFMAVTILAATGFVFIAYRSDRSFEQESEYQIIQDEIPSLSALVGQPQFKDKTVYIDLWFSSCSPCIDQFKNHLPQLKSRLKTEQKEVVYLYIARETSHLDSKLRWKKAIEEYQLKGWHGYLDKDLEKKIWQEIASAPNVSLAANYGYPHYLIAKNGKIISYNAPKPEQINELMPLLTSPE